MIRGESLEEDGGISSKNALLDTFKWENEDNRSQTHIVNRTLKINKGPLNQRVEFSQLNDGNYSTPCGVCESLCSDSNVNAGSMRQNTGSLPVDGLPVNSYSLPSCTGCLPVNADRQYTHKCNKFRNSKSQICKTKNDLTTCDKPTSAITDGNKSASVNLQPSIQCEHNIKYNENADTETNVESTIPQDNNYKQKAKGKPSTEEDILPGKLPVPMVDEATVLKFEPLMTIIDKLADGQSVPPQISMQYEMLRFCTLRSFPKENKPFITRLAQAGFYYASSGDELVCYCCGGRKSNWVEADNPLDVHRKMNPNCKFLTRNNEVNLSVKASHFLAEKTSKGESETRTHDENKANQANTNSSNSGKTMKKLVPNTEEYFKKVKNEDQTFANECSSHIKGCQEKQSGSTKQSCQPKITQSQASDAQANGINVAMKTPSALNEKQSMDLQGRTDKRYLMSKFPKYTAKRVRLASFSDCKNITVSPERLAESGLFYVGYGDCVRCFHCGVGFRDWTADDDPWIEHSRWSKNCSFIIETKGRDFVETVQLAVQYSQLHGENDSHGSDCANTAAANSNAATDLLLHTDAAQSVLEMGYHPNIIQAAIRKVLQSHDRNEVTAAKLMEVIFEIEDNDLGERPSATKSRSETIHDNTNKDNSTNKNEGPKHSVPETDVKESSSHKEMSLNLEVKKMKRENEILKQQTICSKCKKNEVCIVFLPCGHLITCEDCAPSVKYCSFVGCGKYIKGTVRTYMS